ncbi:carboxylesterase family protein [Actinomadura luteofluorescens]|uniref:carboxylesterase/lipase family protein n=1 Tax=Actinomadura luteofluorescens TaxID=46163 RepID=UPI002164E107|nr:carboxylesterase family protein [Actinomadura glauciflava]MCR3740297.1 para-nitrobenzyl esterase [Actinomadura glauciflava]
MKIGRRRPLPALVALIGAVGAATSCAGAQTARLSGGGGNDGQVVRTEYGAVRGKLDGEVRTFQGIPYAAPPVGALRWRDPRPPARWKGARDATRPGSPCPQGPGEVPTGSKNEDCLYLNVTTPKGAPAKPRPVIVWVHGGGFYMGAGSNYDAHRMAAQGDAVVVSVNYRFGVFGFFGHPGLEGSGTYGLKDQQTALSWVNRNIARFGGDPRNVTFAGQSAGAISGCAQLTSPSARGLFSKVILQSGSCSVGWPENFDYRGQQAAEILQPRTAVEAHGRRTASEVGCTGDDQAVVACLRALPVDRLMPVLGQYMFPAYGTDVLPTRPADALRAGRFHRVPVLSGNTHDEATQPTAVYEDAGGGQRGPMTEQTFNTVMTETFGEDEKAVRAEYPRSSYDSAALAWSAIATDRKWVHAQYTTARDLARRVPVYEYEFADPNAPALAPGPPKMPMGAQHASELWYLFDLGGIPPKLDAEQQTLARQMIGYWTSFAATGRPATAGGPRWPLFRATGGRAPHVQSLAPGSGGIRPVDLAAEHHLRFWTDLAR